MIKKEYEKSSPKILKCSERKKKEKKQQYA